MVRAVCLFISPAPAISVVLSYNYKNYRNQTVQGGKTVNFEKMGGTYVPYNEMWEIMCKGLPEELVKWILDNSRVVEAGESRFVDRKSVEGVVKEKLYGKKSSGRISRKTVTGAESTESTDALEAKVKQLEEDIRSRETELADRARQIEKLEDDVKAYEELLDHAATNESTPGKDVRAELEQVRNDYNKVMTDLGRRNVDCTELERAADNLRHKNADIEKKLKEEKSDHKRTKEQLSEARKTIAQLESQRPAAVMCVPEEENKNSSKYELKKLLKESKDAYTALSAQYESQKKELEAARKELEDVKSSISSKNMMDVLKEKQALKELVDQKDREIGHLQNDSKILRASLKERDDIISQKNSELQNLKSSMGKNRTKASERSLFSGIMEMYSGEVTDYIGFLARMRLETLPADAKNGAYMRERDLCTALSAACPESGYQESLAKSIDDAVKQKFEKDSDVGLNSLGFALVASDNHDKYALEGYGDDIGARYVLVFPKTSSDRKARDAAASFMKRMLGFNGKPSSGEERN